MESDLTTIYIVRHGEAQHNVAKQYGEIPESVIHLGYADYEEITSKNIENKAYLKIKSDGIDFFLEETQGVHKTSSNNSGNVSE
jgi:hypothetical protein